MIAWVRRVLGLGPMNVEIRCTVAGCRCAEVGGVSAQEADVVRGWRSVAEQARRVKDDRRASA